MERAYLSLLRLVALVKISPLESTQASKRSPAHISLAALNRPVGCLIEKMDWL